MLKIYICENNNKQRCTLEKIINNIIAFENHNMEIILSTSNPYELLDTIENKDYTGIYFLDIDLNSNINGIDLAKKIRCYDPRGFIIFVTNRLEMSYLSFLHNIEAMDFISKNQPKEIPNRIKNCLYNANNRYIYNSQRIQKVFSIKINGTIINIDYDKILFFETSSNIHKIIVHHMDGEVEFYGKMKALENILDSRFYSCHTSYIVNKDKIKEINKKSRIAHLINNDTCLISTRGLKLLVK